MKSKLQRYGAVVGLMPEKVARYKELHAAAWPDVLADGRPYLFSYFEYVGDDFAADTALMIDDPVTKRCWAECVPCLQLLPVGAPGEIWSPWEEVFHLD